MTKGEDAREEILAAAKRLFLTKGYAAIGMRDIATEAGYKSVAGIYNHFPGKEAIFHELLERNNPSVDVIKIFDTIQGKDAPEFIRNLLHTMLPLISRYYDFFDLAQIDMRELGGTTIRRVLQESIIPRAILMLARVQHLEGLKPLNPVALIRIFISVMMGYLVTQRLSPEIVIHLMSEDEWIEAYTALFIEGLCTTNKDDTT